MFLAYAFRHGYALVDQEVYLPRCWADDADRRAMAGVPKAVLFATKTTLAWPTRWGRRARRDRRPDGPVAGMTMLLVAW